VDAKNCCAGIQDLYIGLVTETYPPEVNGVVMTLNRLVNGLSDPGHRIDIYLPAQSKSETTTLREQGAALQIT
jgi:hypothetical protein